MIMLRVSSDIVKLKKVTLLQCSKNEHVVWPTLGGNCLQKKQNLHSTPLFTHIFIYVIVHVHLCCYY